MPINSNQSVRFKIRLTKSKANWLRVGVVDYEKQKNQRYSYNSGNAICYATSGNKYPDFVKEAEGYKEGDIVEVDVNRSTSTIQYFVNGILKATQIKEILADNSRVFMPYVEMAYANDSIEWLL